MAPFPRLAVRQRWAPPLGAAQVDWSHPLARGLVALLLPHGLTMVDVVQNVPGAVTGTPTATSTAAGPALTVNTTQRVSFANKPASWDMGASTAAAAQMTVAAVCTPGGSGIQRVASQWSNANPTQAFLLYIDDTKASFATQRSAAYDILQSATGAVTAGVPALVVGVRAGTDQRVHVDALQVAQRTAAAGILSGNTEAFSVGAEALENTASVGVGSVWLWNRGLSAPEIAALHADPFAMLR